MKKIWTIIIFLLIACSSVFCQVSEIAKRIILFQGIVIDASTLSPIPESQILVNGSFTAASDENGKFLISVERHDSVEVRVLGYKPVFFHVSDTLAGKEFMTGVYMKSDTLSIGEVVIIPRLSNLRSEILKSSPPLSQELENARYNLAVSAYQGRMSHSKLGDPESNYQVLLQKQKLDAYEKGGVPSDKMVGLNPFLLVPAAYLLINGFPEKPAQMKSDLTKQEINQIHEKYMKSIIRKD